MRIEREYTFEEFRQAYLTVQRERQRNKPARLRQFGWTFTALLVMGIFTSAVTGITRAGMDSRTVEFHTVVPVVAVMLMATCFASMAVWLAGNRRSMLKTLPALVLLAGLSVGLLVLVFPDQKSLIPGTFKTQSPWLLLMPHATWLIFMTMFMLAAIRGQFAGIRRQWNENKPLQRQRTFEFTVDGITDSTVFSTCHYNWQAVVKCQEIDRLFLLYLSPLSFMMIPKRSFANNEEIDAFRNMTKSLISRENQAGFAVEMAQQEKVK